MFLRCNKRFFYFQGILLDLIIKGGERFEKENFSDRYIYPVGISRTWRLRRRGDWSGHHGKRGEQYNNHSTGRDTGRGEYHRQHSQQYSDRQSGRSNRQAWKRVLGMRSMRREKVL